MSRKRSSNANPRSSITNYLTEEEALQLMQSWDDIDESEGKSTGGIRQGEGLFGMLDKSENPNETTAKQPTAESFIDRNMAERSYGDNAPFRKKAQAAAQKPNNTIQDHYYDNPKPVPAATAKSIAILEEKKAKRPIGRNHAPKPGQAQFIRNDEDEEAKVVEEFEAQRKPPPGAATDAARGRDHKQKPVYNNEAPQPGKAQYISNSDPKHNLFHTRKQAKQRRQQKETQSAAASAVTTSVNDDRSQSPKVARGVDHDRSQSPKAARGLRKLKTDQQTPRRREASPRRTQSESPTHPRGLRGRKKVKGPMSSSSPTQENTNPAEAKLRAYGLTSSEESLPVPTARVPRTQIVVNLDETSDTADFKKSGRISNASAQSGAVSMNSFANISKSTVHSLAQNFDEEIQVSPHNDDDHDNKSNRQILRDRDFLVRATLVRSTNDLGVDPNAVYAEPVESEDIVIDFFKSPKGISIIVCSILILAGIITGLVLGLGGGSEPLIAPTAAPSMSPTQAPTVDFVEELLPAFTREAITSNDDSPQAQAWKWIMKDPALNKIESERKFVRFALAVLYFATTGPRWEQSTNWLSYDHHECKWSTNGGLSMCSNDLLVTNIDLERNNLRGVIPPEISLLADVVQLDLRDNFLEGSLTSEFGTLAKLRTLLLSTNGLGGKIPTEFGNLSALQELHLAYNKLQGTLPTEFGSLKGLRRLRLQENSFEGGIPSELGLAEGITNIDLSNTGINGWLPTELGSMRYLQYLDLSRTQIQGEIPKEFGLVQNLTELDLSECLGLNGTLPTELGLLSQLESLHLNNLGLYTEDPLGGSIPSELFMATNLRVLDLESSPFNSAIPSEIGSLTKLSSLFLNGCLLSSTLPSEIGLLQEIKNLDLSDLGINGPLPSELGQLPLETLLLSNLWNLYGPLPGGLFNNNNLRDLEIYSCTLTGALPTEIGLATMLTSLVMNQPGFTDFFSLAGLLQLWMSSNSFTGTIPSEIMMASLETLELSSTSLSGTIPSEIALLGNLTSMNLAGNVNLTGSLPATIQNMSQLKVLNLQTTGLTAAFTFVPPDSLSLLSLSYTKLESSIPSQIGQWTQLQDLSLLNCSLWGSIPTTCKATCFHVWPIPPTF
ncbi:LRR receptor-like serine threonine-protein kinase [Seminavis robusta]|uniref:LRR receptor-like serine threonine-protein kinase n=1 Tax=Seminavis robusta TaxID=568900 RepID=A0A9N8DZS3_9STRA|nr:LRR receptor-like serine threonine-protein kinase [Seminavis robusta]|eukprot:Sro478_g151070.1 LRR receptor-like serine threonine-protein kinase (1119) ;mRNA; f:52031-55712